MTNTRIMSANSAHIFCFTNVPKLDRQEVFPCDLYIHCRDNISIATEDLVVSNDSDDYINSSYRLPSTIRTSQVSHPIRSNSDLLTLSLLNDQRWPLSHASQPPQSPSLTLNHECNYFSALLNVLGGNSVTVGGKDSSSCATSTLLDNRDDFKLKLSNNTQVSAATATTCASTMVESTSSSSEFSPASSGESLHSAVVFANRCLVRSYERRLPSYVHLSSSLASSSAASQKSFSSDQSISSSSTASFKSSRSVRQSFRRDQEIKMKLIKMKIIICRQKCTRSLNKAMAHYNRLNASNTLQVLNSSTNCQAKPTTDVALVVSKEKISVDLLFGRINSLFILYEDSLSHIIDLL